MLIRLSAHRVVGFSRVCTHAGCLVQYDSNARVLVCPCHGAEFDPAHGAQPISGPALTALPAVNVVIDRATGEVIAQG
jgi:thiosulfate dehydrogenase [quinone] large subunit